MVVKEHVEIPVFDSPETHRGCHVVDPGHVQSLLASVLASTVSARAAPETDYRQAPTTSTVPTISPTTETMVPANVLICRESGDDGADERKQRAGGPKEPQFYTSAMSRWGPTEPTSLARWTAKHRVGISICAVLYGVFAIAGRSTS